MSKCASRVGGGLLLLALGATWACEMNDDRVVTGETSTESKTVELGSAKSVRAQLNMKAGELRIDGGATHLFEGEFTYNVAEWKPSVSYQVRDGIGNLEVEQPGSVNSSGNTRNDWNIQLASRTPMELTVNMGAGRAKLTLGSLALSRLELNIGAGETTVDLTGDWKKDLEAEIHGGVGKATIRLPRAVGVHVVAHGGLGKIDADELRQQGDAYVNDLYGKSPVTLRVEVEGGVGEIRLESGGEGPGA